MTSNTNNSDQVNEELLHDELHEKLLYELLLYKKKDIIAIQVKLGMAVSERSSYRSNDKASGNEVSVKYQSNIKSDMSPANHFKNHTHIDTQYGNDFLLTIN